jgi:hypothetical protein
MADYYPLIARAVEGLDDRGPTMRNAVYERARSALVDQLRSLEPPLSQGDIDRECRDLEDAIRRVEAENNPILARQPAPAPVPAKPVPPPKAAPAPRPEPTLAGAGAPPLARRDEPPPREEPPEDEFERDFDVYAPEFSPAYEEPSGPTRPRVDSRSPRVHSPNRKRAAILAAVLALVIGAIAIAAWRLRDTPQEIAQQSPPAAPAAPAPGEGPKIAERVGGGPPIAQPPARTQPNQPAPAAPPRADVSVAQRAVYYEEDPSNPQQPRAFPGRALWRLEGVNTGQGQPLETAVRAVVEVPETGIVLNLLMRRNSDPTLPASHTIELNFATPPGDTGRAIRDVGLLQFKNEEAARGTPIAGLPVPVRENLFLIGLSNLQSDIERNIDLIVRRNWIDLPVRTASGQRAILSIEKGPAGEQVINDAFRQWQ